MARIDWSSEDRKQLEPGTYHVEVLTAEERTSRKGDTYFNVGLGAIDFGGRRLCYDNIMLEGGGRSMGQAKLVALGIEKGTPEVHPDSLIGLRAYAFVSIEEFNGKKRLSVDISRGSHCGYWLESEKENIEDLHTVDGFTPDESPFDTQTAEDDVPF